MQNAYIINGTLDSPRTLTLDEALPLPPTRVRVVVEPLSQPGPRTYAETVGEIRRRQEARGHRPPAAHDVNAELDAERDSWDKP